MLRPAFAALDGFSAAYAAANETSATDHARMSFSAAYAAANQSGEQVCRSHHFSAAYAAANESELALIDVPAFLSCLRGSKHRTAYRRPWR